MRLSEHTIHLPLNYSDGEPIEPEKIRLVREDLFALFGSFVVPYRRAWKYDGRRYVEIMKIEILTTGDMVAGKLLAELKERLKESLQQVDILITTRDIQVI